MRTLRLPLLAASFCWSSASRASAQTLGGQVVDLKTGHPLTRATVALVDDSARVVATVAADSATGDFYLDAPRAGRYRAVLFTSGGSFVAPAVSLDSGKTVERKFSVPTIDARFADAYFAAEVTTPAEMLPGAPGPRFPDVARFHHRAGAVATMFIVDETGKPDARTIQVVNDAKPEFADVVRGWLPSARFKPAIRDGQPVRQVVQLTVAFTYPDLPTPAADIVITALGVERTVGHP